MKEKINSEPAKKEPVDQTLHEFIHSMGPIHTQKLLF